MPSPNLRQISRAKLYEVFKTDELVRLVEDILTALNDTLPGDTTLVEQALSDHIADTGDAHQASAIGFTPTGGISSNTVQAAIAEVDSEKMSGPSSFATSRLLGRGSAGGAGNAQEITVGSGLTMTGTTLSASGAGSGDVVGPASSTANAIATFSGTTGKLLQDSAVTIDTDGTMAANSDTRVPTQKAVRTYVASSGGGSSTATYSRSFMLMGA